LLGSSSKADQQGLFITEKGKKKALKVASPWAGFVGFQTRCGGEEWFSVSERRHSRGQVAFV